MACAVHYAHPTQNAFFLHFFSKKFAYIKKKQYFCIVFHFKRAFNLSHLMLNY